MSSAPAFVRKDAADKLCLSVDFLAHLRGRFLAHRAPAAVWWWPSMPGEGLRLFGGCWSRCCWARGSSFGRCQRRPVATGRAARANGTGEALLGHERVVQALRKGLPRHQRVRRDARGLSAVRHGLVPPSVRLCVPMLRNECLCHPSCTFVCSHTNHKKCYTIYGYCLFCSYQMEMKSCNQVVSMNNMHVTIRFFSPMESRRPRSGIVEIRKL